MSQLYIRLENPLRQGKLPVFRFRANVLGQNIGTGVKVIKFVYNIHKKCIDLVAGIHKQGLSSSIVSNTLHVIPDIGAVASVDYNKVNRNTRLDHFIQLLFTEGFCRSADIVILAIRNRDDRRGVVQRSQVLNLFHCEIKSAGQVGKASVLGQPGPGVFFQFLFIILLIHAHHRLACACQLARAGQNIVVIGCHSNPAPLSGDSFGKPLQRQCRDVIGIIALHGHSIVHHKHYVQAGGLGFSLFFRAHRHNAYQRQYDAHHSRPNV